MKRILGGLLFFTLGGAAAAVLPLTAGPHPAKAPPPASPALPGGRIAVTPAELSQAYAAGLIDRPIKSILDVRSRLTYGDFRWDDRGVPSGPTWIRVDLSSQMISVFRSGYEIGTAVILYGADGVATPIGNSRSSPN